KRVELSFGVPLDVDRLRIELARTERQLLTARSDISEALSTCALYVGASCHGFEDGAAARAFLERWIEATTSEGAALEQRPDLRALSAYADAARAATRLARNQAIPDPTLRFGYLHDRFLESGNHMNSLS